MARDRGDFYQGVDPNKEEKRPAPRGQLGALARQQVSPETTGSTGEAPGLSQMMRPREEFGVLKERNKAFLSDPQTQAALLTFATGMMQPISSSGDLLGLFGNSLANSARAAAGVEMAQTEEAEKMRQAMLDERKFGLDERQVDMAERELEAKLGTAGQRATSRVITANDPLNARFKLGLTGNQQAKVEVTEDANGNVINADLEASFGDEGEAAKPTEISKLQKERDLAVSEGRKADADQLQSRINQLSQEANITSGQKIEIGPDGKERIVPIPGGKAETEALAREEAEGKAKRLEQSKKDAILFNIDEALETIQNPARVGGKSIPADAYLTGFGSLSSYIPGTPAKDLAENLGSIGARLQLDELQKMREASTTGGSGLGNVSNFEGMTLRNAYFSLSQGQTAAQLTQNLKRFRLMFDDVVGGGQLSTLDKQVKAGEMTLDDARRQVDALFGSEQNGNTQADPETEPNIDFNAVPPWITDEEQKLDWQYLPLPNRQQIWKGGATK